MDRRGRLFLQIYYIVRCRGGYYPPAFSIKSYSKKGDFAVCGRRLRFHLRLPYTAGVFRSLRRAAEGFALRTHKLFEKSLIKNLKKVERPFLHGHSTNNILILIFRKLFAKLFLEKAGKLFLLTFFSKK